MVNIEEFVVVILTHSLYSYSVELLIIVALENTNLTNLEWMLHNIL